nr:SIR2 family protein [Flexivirga oryzae]
MGAGLPSWSELLDHLKDGLSSDAEIVNSDDFKALPPLDQAELLQRLRRRGIADEVVEAVTVKESGKAFRPALGHFLLAGLRCRQVATTNYDLLYEAAVRSQGDSQQIHALPYERPAPPNPWILKLHGDVEHDDLVLSRSSFVEYDGRRSATGAVFQAMLLTSHVLFVGLSFTDDNVLRLTHEVTAAPLEGEKTLGTALGLGVSSAKKELWRGVLEWVDLSAPDDHPPRPMGWTKPRETKESADKRWETAWQVRELEIFLDTVALWSVRGEPSCERPPRRLQSDQG